MQPANSASIFACASAGAIQLLFGPASSLSRRADEGQVLDARDVGRVGAVQVAIGKRCLVEFDQVAGGEHHPDELVALGVRPVHQWMRSGWVSLADSATQSRRAAFVVVIDLVPFIVTGAGPVPELFRGGSGIPIIAAPTPDRAATRQTVARGGATKDTQKKAPSEEGAIRGRTVRRSISSNQFADDQAALRARPAVLRTARFALRRAGFTSGVSSAASRTFS